jgi:hypothetical protein
MIPPIIQTVNSPIIGKNTVKFFAPLTVQINTRISERNHFYP